MPLDMNKRRLIKRFTYVFGALFLIALMFFLLRGPYLSNSIKRVIQPLLEDAIGERIIIDKAVINLFPFYLQTKGFKVFDKEGNRLLWVTKMRAYIDLISLFSREINIRRLTLKEPNLTIDREQLNEVIASYKERSERPEGRKIRLSLKNAKIIDGKFTLTDEERGIRASGNGLYIGLITKKSTDIDLSLKDMTLKLPELQEIKAGFEGKIKIDGKDIRISGVKVYSFGSTLQASGRMHLSPESLIKQGTFSGKARLLIDSIRKVFNLRQSGDGVLSLSGSIDLISSEVIKGDLRLPSIKLDLKTKGWFYLQTLMELLGVDKGISGRLSIDGEIRGLYPRLRGNGKAVLEDAYFGSLHIDKVEGEVKYNKRRFTLNNFIAFVYGGRLRGNASLLIPSGEYRVSASVSDINSRQFFRFIKWQPPFPEGKIRGPFTLIKKPGRKIELVARATYLNSLKDKGHLLQERLRKINADIEMKNNILRFNKAVLSTSSSNLSIKGIIDLNQKKLDLDIEMDSREARDLTAPYFYGLKAPVRFTGKAAGFFKNPQIYGSLNIGSGSINGEPFDEVSGYLTYTPELLSLRLLRILKDKSIYEVSGSITFRGTRGLFSFRDPYYKAKAVLKNGDARSLITAVYRELPIKGLIDAELIFEGDNRIFKGRGDIWLKDFVAFNQPVDRVFIKTILSQDKIDFLSIEAQEGKSQLKGAGSIYFDRRFALSLSSTDLRLKDIVPLSKYPVNAVFDLDIKGSGTFKNPVIESSIKVKESYFRGFPAGEGNIKAELKGRKLYINAYLLDGVLTADASLAFTDAMPWDVSMSFKKGRYDFLLAGFLREVPRDLSASIEGVMRLKGKKNKFTMNSRFGSLNFSLYGYNFKNKKDVILEFSEDEFRIKSFSLISRDADINATGVIRIGKGYNLAINGRLRLAPLKALTQSVESLKGRGSFVVEIKGPWESPELDGKINIRDAVVLLSGMQYSIGPINGDIFLDKDRIIFDSFNADFAGGVITLSGIGYLKGLSPDKFLLSSEIKGIRLRPVEDVDMAFDAELFFESSHGRQSIMGDIDIKRAIYKKRVEWKSWLLRFKKAKDVSMRQPSFLGKTALNIHIKGKDNIFIDNNIARTPVKIDINIQGTLQQYGIIGRIETREGKIFFRNNEFDIIEGNVDFIEVNRITPVFHILAETFISGYRIRLNLDGPMERFDLSLFSDPPLSEMQILTLLASGQPGKEARGFESGIGAGEATAFLTGRLQDVIEERFKEIAGFDRFEVNPQTTATGAVSPTVTIGKQLIRQRLFVTYSTTMGTTEENIIRLQYDLSKNLSIIGLRDEIGSLGADIKLRFEFK
jgi:translocation and assembly module TamB